MRIRMILTLCGVAAALLSGVLGPSGRARAASAANCSAWLDQSKTPDQRAQALLAAMSIDDKVKMIYQNDTIWTYYGVAGHVGPNAALCIPDLVLNDAGQGVGDQMQFTTAYPSPIAQSASWDRALQTRFGDRLGWEAWHKGVNVQLAPGLNIARVPMNGRNWEYMGEDPYFTGQTATAEIQGIQGQHVVATMKHYAFNNQETNRNSASSDIDSRTAHEIYLPGWETAVKQGGVGAAMCSYNKVKIDQEASAYACQTPTLLTTYLKQEFGFDGWIMSDWGAMHDAVPSHLAGLDQDMAGTAETGYRDAVKAAAQTNPPAAARLDDAVTRILRTMFRIGLFDNPTPAQPGAASSNTMTPESLNVARDVAVAGTVLLKNTGVLPITGTLKRIALIGKAAGPAGALLVYNGGGSGHIPEVGYKTEAEVVSPLRAIEARAVFANDTVTYTDGTVIQDAVAAATAADYAIVYANDAAGEGTDRPSLDLNRNSGECTLVGCTYANTQQNELISAVAGANPNTIVVLNTAGPVLMPWRNEVEAILEAWYPGQEDGNAIAPILFGDVNPSGKLPQTFPNNDDELPKPSTAANIPYTEGLLVGYRWYDAMARTPLFCFGHGLSYTTFAYSALTVTPGPGNTAMVSFTLTNSGGRTGSEVAQVYLGFPASTGEPPKQLKGYQKVLVPAFSSVPVTLTLDRRAFSYWNPTSSWTVAPGTYHISVGSSSCDIRVQGDISMSPTAITLRSFSARHTGARGVGLRWRTGAEAELLGFNVYRGRARLNGAPIPARHATGGAYSYLDRRPEAGSPRYRLQAVRLDGTRAWLGSATVR